MRTPLRRWLNEIPVRDPIQRRQATLLQGLLIALLLTGGLAIVLSAFVFGAAALTLSGLAPNLIVMACVVSALAALRRAHAPWME